MTTLTAAKERPILFSAPMVRAILAGAKTQTRRVAKLTEDGRLKLAGGCAAFARDGIGIVWNPYGGAPEQPMPAERVATECPYGKPGDRLWVREAAYVAPPNFGDRDLTNCTDSEGRRRLVGYVADMDAEACEIAEGYGVKKSPSIHMPRWACRIVLEVVSVRVERLSDITEADAQAEGVEKVGPTWTAEDETEAEICPGYTPGPMTYTNGFYDIWEAINGPGSWEANPWVWVVEFRRLADA